MGLSRRRPETYDRPVRTSLVAGFALLGSAVLCLTTSGAPVDPPPAAEQHVTVPSLPGQPNKDAVVRPSGSLKTDAAGWVVTKPEAGEKSRPAPRPASAARSAPMNAPMPRVGPAPSGPAIVTGNNTMTIRGVVEAISPSQSVTIRRPSSGSVVTYPLAPGAALPAGLKPGDSVKLRVLALEKDRVAERVERVEKPKAP